MVQDLMEENAKGLNPEDGYDVGQTIYALVWSEEDEVVGTPLYRLTSEDLN